jgi:pimeloyl-ACP methyl ester carboxylesterase
MRSRPPAHPAVTPHQICLCLTLLASAALLCGCSCPLDKKSPAPASAPRTLVIQRPAGAIVAEESGAGGLPVLFVHGLGGDSRVWAEQVARLRPQRTVVAMGLPGHGQSAPSKSGDYSVQTMASAVGAVADALHLKRFVLVGHSWGGAIVAAYAGAHPDRVAGILFADPVGDLTKLTPKEIEGFRKSVVEGDQAANILGFFKQMLAPAAPGVADRVLATVKATPAPVFTAAWEGLFAYSPVPDLSRFPGPMLTIITPQNKEPYSLQNLDPKIQVVEMTGTSHWLMMDKPEEFDAAMDRFLVRCESSR